jgi:hypothetical protein
MAFIEVIMLMIKVNPRLCYFLFSNIEEEDHMTTTPLAIVMAYFFSRVVIASKGYFLWVWTIATAVDFTG